MKSLVHSMLFPILGLVSASLVASELPKSDELATQAGPLTVTAISHATMVFEWEGKTLFVDPVGGKESFAAHGQPDLILITDFHGDHLDLDTVSSVRKDGTEIVAPAAVIERFADGDRASLISLANDESIDVQGIGIEAIAMYNLTPERKDFHAKGRGNGYVLTIGGSRVYISGDTEDVPEMRALEGIDAAFVCMNLPYTMDVEHAADAVLTFRPKVVYPYHYRGKGMISDLDTFASLVAKDEGIEVRRLAWY